MRNVFVMPVFFFILTNAMGANFDCSNYKEVENECAVVVRGKSFGSVFPIEDPNENYEWNLSSSHPEYMWETELGVCKGKNFTSFGYAYSVFSSNILNQEKKNSGSLEQLIHNRNAHGSFYEKPEGEGFGGRFDDIFPSLKIHSTVVPEGALLVYSEDSKAHEIFFSKKPTHAKLTMKTPSPKQSYTCVAEVVYQ